MPVDEVAGDVDSSPFLEGAAIHRKGLVGKGGTGTGKGDTLKGLQDWKTGAESEDRCASEEG